MARSRTAPTDLGRCPVHGDVVVAKHAAGTTDAGRPRHVYRCLDCHASAADARRRDEAAPSATIGFCRAEATANGVPVRCDRPYGHPPDVHVSADGAMFAARVDTPH